MRQNIVNSDGILLDSNDKQISQKFFMLFLVEIYFLRKRENQFSFEIFFLRRFVFIDRMFLQFLLHPLTPMEIDFILTRSNLLSKH